MNQAIVPPLAASDVASPVAFTGVRGDFRRLIMRGALLELVTLGFYRFWLATDMRRHLWSQTSVGGDAPEYTGTAKELLIGFLIALAILVPIYLVYFFIGIEAERYQAFASIPLVLFFYLFAQFAIYRARRYRLSRTIWRGIRFWMTGSGWSYAWRAGLWTLLSIVTIGLALPWQQAALERYKMRHTFFGDLAGRFDGTGGGLFKLAWWVWLVTLALVVLTGISGASMPAGAAVLGLIIVVWAPFAFAIYKACEWRWWVDGLRFGELRFESKLASDALMGLYWKVIGWSWLIILALFVWGGVMFSVAAVAAGGFQNMNAEASAAIAQSPAFLIALVIGYLACALAFGVVVRMYLRRDVWARVVASALIYNLAAADNVVAKGDAVNALGEGFADGLDIGGF